MSDGLLSAADAIERELICCDVFERLSAKPANTWADDEQREFARHQICYWGSAARALVLDEIHKPKHEARKPHPICMAGR